MTIPTDIQISSLVLADSLRQSRQIAAFIEAKVVMEQDAQLQALLKELAALQAEIRAGQQTVTQARVNELRALQCDVQANDKVRAFVEAQQVARWHLDEVVNTFSEQLGTDFTALSSASCCT